MEEFIFMVRHIPFWATPVGLLSAEFAYFLWLKDRRNAAKKVGAVGVACFAFILFYFITGGPDKSVLFVMDFFNLEDL